MTHEIYQEHGPVYYNKCADFPALSLILLFSRVESTKTSQMFLPYANEYALVRSCDLCMLPGTKRRHLDIYSPFQLSGFGWQYLFMYTLGCDHIKQKRIGNKYDTRSKYPKSYQRMSSNDNEKNVCANLRQATSQFG